MNTISRPAAGLATESFDAETLALLEALEVPLPDFGDLDLDVAFGCAARRDAARDILAADPSIIARVRERLLEALEPSIAVWIREELMDAARSVGAQMLRPIPTTAAPASAPAPLAA
ncbi:hypothetical protein [Streptomyces sp. NRRL F-5065]|uniref:hypothetical protein n=1 Tax=Streptomyces sp. NRRL F-5065 TaxID=1463855 RepID=UPI00068FF894|nr:hypothetical protein [Streptomyces sp. NRRL F-5065]